MNAQKVGTIDAAKPKRINALAHVMALIIASTIQSANTLYLI